ncbi:MAG: YfcE family phosphodiesterase [Halodesulfurarchaeum sp.]
MIVVVSDTHRTDGPDLSAPLRETIQSAKRVAHAGDFTTEAVLEGFQSLADTVHGVAGNRDRPAVADRLPAARTFAVGPYTVAMTHRQAGGRTGLSHFGAERDADLVISGHTHQPHVVTGSGPALLNPGSHADPRGGDPTYATLELAGDTLCGRVLTVEGRERESFQVEGRNGPGGGA